MTSDSHKARRGIQKCNFCTRLLPGAAQTAGTSDPLHIQVSRLGVKSDDCLPVPGESLRCTVWAVPLPKQAIESDPPDAEPRVPEV